MTVYCIAITFVLAFVLGLGAGLVLYRGKKGTKTSDKGHPFCPDAEIINFLNYNGEQQ